MGTYMTLTAYGASAEEALAISEDRIRKLESLWSVADENSDIYRVNQSGGMSTEIHEETAEILQFALDMAKQTNGALDPTIFPVVTAWGFISGEYRIPTEDELKDLLQNIDYEKVLLEGNFVTLPDGMQLDLGAVGKGYAGDIIAELLKERGVTSALLDIGGNIQMVGRKPDGSKWRLGIQNPFGEGCLGILESEDGAVVTSGNYERYFIGEDGRRYGHIVDPSTGHPAESGLASVTIIAGEGRLCDALSTSLFIMGLDPAIEYWRQHQNFNMILIAENGEVYLTSGIADAFALDGHHSNMKVNVIQDA